MTRTGITTGFLSVYIGAVVLLRCPFYASTHPTMEVSKPTIVRHTFKGHKLTCLVNPGGLKDETQVYWLADGDFLEEKYKNFNLKNTERMSADGTVLLHSRVLLQDLTSKDLSTNFTCVALSPAGFAKQNVQLKKGRRRR